MTTPPHPLSRRWPLAAVLVAATALLYPSVETGWVGDDAFNSTLPAYWQIVGLDAASETLVQIRSWCTAAGRFNPLMHVWKNGWFWCVRDLRVHKGLILALVALDLWLLYRLCRAFGLSREASALAALLGALLVQFREFHDPVLGFNGTMPFVAALALGSLVCLCRHRETGRPGWLGASLALHLAGCLTYECCLVLCVAHVALLPWRRALPFVAVAVMVLGVNLALRATNEAPADSPYRMVLRGSLVWKTFARQCVAALPLTYGGFDPFGTFAGTGFVQAWAGHAWVGAAVAALAAGLAYGVKREDGRTSTPLGFLMLLGVGLLVLPAVPIAVCHRYQWELAAGLGHLPVYLQQFGVALLLIGTTVVVSRRCAAGWSRLALAACVGVACGVIAAGHGASNAAVVEVRGQQHRFRAGLEESLRAGLLDPVPEGGTLITDGHPWDTAPHGEAFYLMHAGKRLGVNRTGGPSWRLFHDGTEWRLEFPSGKTSVSR